MNREILFRGKNENIKKWVYGSLLEFLDGDCYICKFPDNLDVDKPDALDMYAVNPETIGQYTGATDKKGEKIFEGDIIKGKGKNAYAVEYSPNIAGFIAKGFGILSRPCMNAGTVNYYEVVGNIHDNPELLGGVVNA